MHSNRRENTQSQRPVSIKLTVKLSTEGKRKRNELSLFNENKAKSMNSLIGMYESQAN